jgi:hypothetical protein
MTATTQRIYFPPSVLDWLHRPVSIAPLVVFRLVFGALMVFSVARFWYLGWIEDHFLEAKVTFKYYGFGWVEVLSPWAMYALHVAMFVGALGILLGFYYRVSAALFFLTFTYTELIDLTYYLNHYYFVSLAALCMVFVPAHRLFSLDVWRWPHLAVAKVPQWCIRLFQFQITLVYLYAGLAKINHAWLIEAMPLRIWLPANDALPIVGPLLCLPWMPWVFSWAGMLFDCTIVAFLAHAPTRPWAYAAILVFHLLTGLMFQIGVFPLVMSGCVLLFFSERWHERFLGTMKQWLNHFSSFISGRAASSATPDFEPKTKAISQLNPITATVLAAYIAFQILFPWRYLLYPGNLLWTEEGYRFSWRVMLMEKAGTATFYVKDRQNGHEGVVDNSAFLCAHQEKQMAMQPDMILQYAHFLARHYAAHGVSQPSVRAEAYVTLNGRPGQLLIDPQLDLTTIADGWQPKQWILTY